MDWDGGRGPLPHVPSAQCPVPSAQLHNAQCTIAHHTKVTISPHHPHPHPHPHPPQPVRHNRATDRSVRVSQVPRVIRFRFLFQLPPPKPKFLRVHTCIDHDYLPSRHITAQCPLADDHIYLGPADLRFTQNHSSTLYIPYMYLLHVPPPIPSDIVCTLYSIFPSATPVQIEFQYDMHRPDSLSPSSLQAGRR